MGKHPGGTNFAHYMVTVVTIGMKCIQVVLASSTPPLHHNKKYSNN